MLLTYYKTPIKSYTQLSIEDLYNNIPVEQEQIINLGETNTVETTKLPKRHDQNSINTNLAFIKLKLKTLKDYNINDLYYTFNIPKRNGGLRKINAPKEPLKSILKDVKNIIESDLKVLCHNSAYAYIKHRSPKQELQVHQKNNSKWFLKLDVKNFFPSCNKDFIVNQLKKLYPFTTIKTEEIVDIIKYCMLNDELPQGTPISPLLSNLVMLPIDYKIQKELIQKGFIYTRYADDILISHKKVFNFNDIENKIIQIFEEENAPFTIKKEKTRYGSSSGRNWNLGLMLNKDNQITIGNRKKRLAKIILNNFLKDYYNNNKWNKEDTYKLQGMISYYRNIEPEYIKDLILKYEQKYKELTNYKSFKEICKEIINE